MNQLPPSAVRPGDKPGDAHRRAYPEQYAHRLVGKRVKVDTGKFQTEGTVERVVSSRFGQLAKLDNSGETLYLVQHCTVA